MADKNIEMAVLGGGCFWCLEATYELINGVANVVSGYSGGTDPEPTYEKSAYRNTGEAEVVRITFEPSIISYADILEIFWTIHDPTTLNRQGNDKGPEYRSIIFYLNEQQKQIAEESRKQIQNLWKDPIVTEIVPLQKFYEAEEEHQNFYKKHPEQAYCQIVINPKLEKLRAKFASKLKQS